MTTFDYIISMDAKREEKEGNVNFTACEIAYLINVLQREKMKESKLRAREERRRRLLERKAERTCFDFVLCLKKRRNRDNKNPQYQPTQEENKDLHEKPTEQRALEDIKVYKAALVKTSTNRDIEEDIGTVCLDNY